MAVADVDEAVEISRSLEAGATLSLVLVQEATLGTNWESATQITRTIAEDVGI